MKVGLESIGLPEFHFLVTAEPPNKNKVSIILIVTGKTVNRRQAKWEESIKSTRFTNLQQQNKSTKESETKEEQQTQMDTFVSGHGMKSEPKVLRANFVAFQSLFPKCL